MFKNAITAASLLIVAGFSGHAMAATTSTSTFLAKITITSTCDVTTTAPTEMNFGTEVAGANNNVSAQSTITVKCSKGTPYDIGLTPATSQTGTSAGAGKGLMNAQNVSPTTGNTDQVPYELYSDNAHSKAWGDQVNTNTVHSTGQGLTVTDTHTVYGVVPSTDFTPDSYQDTVTVTLTY